MEQIPIEVILKAEAFISNLSEEDQEKLWYIYEEEQPHLILVFYNMLKDIKDKNIIAKCQYLYLVIYRSYKYYGVKLAPLKHEKVMDIHFKIAEILFKNESKFQSGDGIWIEMKMFIQQDNLVDFIIIFLIGPPDNPYNFKIIDDFQASNAELITSIIILNNEMKKHIGDEIN